MSAADFMNVMLAQLQQQDPLNPTSSSDMLTQMSQIEGMQTNQSLNTTLQGLSLQQAIGAGAGMIGKAVSGIAADGTTASGNVTSISVRSQNVYLELDSNNELPLANVTSIGASTAVPAAVVATPATTAAATTAAAATTTTPTAAATTAAATTAGTVPALLSALSSL